MADLQALMTSLNEHYLTPPVVVDPMRAVLVPAGSRRTLFDTSSNSASLIGADKVADGVAADGLITPWSCCSSWWGNFPYGRKLLPFAEKAAYWGRERGVPGMTLTPARTDPEWAQILKAAADAWVEVAGRLVFWTVIAIRKADAPEVDVGDKKGPMYLQRWWPWATEQHLPKPFRLLGNGFAVGPEISKDGKPSPAPFPSLICFFADPKTHDYDPRDELEALRELARVAILDVTEAKIRGRENGDSSRVEACARWLVRAEQVLGERYNDVDDLRLESFERLLSVAKRRPKHPVDVRTFAVYFRRLGALTVARGPHASYYRRAK